MLHEFLKANRDVIVERAAARAAARCSPGALRVSGGKTLFLEELESVFPLEVSRQTAGSERPSGDAAAYGSQLLGTGRPIAEIVHASSDLRQIVTALAREAAATIPLEEIQALDECLERLTAGAVEEYSRLALRRAGVEARRRIGGLAHDLRNSLAAASLSFEIIKSGAVPIGGSTGLILERSLIALRDAIDRALEPRRDGVPRDIGSSEREGENEPSSLRAPLSLVRSATPAPVRRRGVPTAKAKSGRRGS